MDPINPMSPEFLKAKQLCNEWITAQGDTYIRINIPLADIPMLHGQLCLAQTHPENNHAGILERVNLLLDVFENRMETHGMPLEALEVFKAQREQGFGLT